jgi:phosphoribosylformylglycinamidine (FGAM) synthase PurS component
MNDLRDKIILEMMHDAERSARLKTILYTLEKAMDVAVVKMFDVLLEGSSDIDRREAVSQVAFELLGKSMVEVFDRNY